MINYWIFCLPPINAVSLFSELATCPGICCFTWLLHLRSESTVSPVGLIELAASYIRGAPEVPQWNQGSLGIYLITHPIIYMLRIQVTTCLPV